jgi:rubrerythrin
MHHTLSAILSLIVPGVVATGGTAVSESTKTIDNLQAAYNGESNARARYAALARKADEEGFGKGASLFRAAAKAEEIHARNHAAVIEKRGGVAVLKIHPTEVGSTPENLQVAIEGEKYERDVMYPEFIDMAKRGNAAAAVRTFTSALKVEAVRSYSKMRWTTWSNGGESATPITSAPDCGNTLEELTIVRCLICRQGKSGFPAVNWQLGALEIRFRRSNCITIAGFVRLSLR